VAVFLAKKFPSLAIKNSESGLLAFAKALYSINGIRYVLFGVLNTVFGYLSFVVASQIFGQQFPPTIILLIGLGPAIVFAYTTQRIFIWRSKGAVRTELPKFLAVTFAQFGVNALLLELLVALKLGVLFSQTLLTITIPVATFFAHKFWTFRHPKTIVGKKAATRNSEKVKIK
jgi:putative flippase GtrA